MRRLRALLILCAALLAGTAQAQTVVADLSQRDVQITADFDGSDILIYGAIKGEAEGSAPLDVIIAISGPNDAVTVRKKDRRMGIWVNTEAVEVARAPSFYAVAATGPLEEVLSPLEDIRFQVSIRRAIYAVGTPDEVEDAEAFTEALIRLRKKAKLYQQLDGAVTLYDQTLFSTTLAMPANLVEGVYPMRIFLTRDGQVVSRLATFIDVRKVGLERWIYDLAHEKPLIYGILSLIIAITAGWLASAVFRYIRF
jgi:uncharacterized protein (TIGR02186 family)